PLCGMALEPVEPTPEEGPNEELEDMSRRLKIGVIFTTPLLILAMSEMVPPLRWQERLGGELWNWIQLLLASPVVLWVGAPLFVRGYQSVRNRSLNMFSLIALGTGMAYAYSLIAT